MTPLVPTPPGGRPVPLVLGVGNPWRGDDGVGAAVARTVAARLTAPAAPAVGPVDVVELDGEPTRVVDRWAGRPLVLAVDAVVSGADPGTVHRRVVVGDGADVDPAALAADGSPAGGGSHALGLSEAVRLGWVLDRLPDRLVVLGVEGSRFDHSEAVALQPAVAAAVPAVVDAVLDELAIWSCFDDPPGGPARPPRPGGGGGVPPCA